MLTTEEKAKVFAMYLGSPAIDTEELGNGKQLHVQDVSYSKELGMATVTLQNDNDTDDWWPRNDLDCIKLILTDLSDISDEDINEAWVCSGMEPHVSDFSKEAFLETFDPSKCAHDKDRFGQSVYLLVYDFLRSRSYHLPYKNINLYEAGIAIKPQI